MNAPALFPTADAVSTAALHRAVLGRLADARGGLKPHPETIQALCDDVGQGDRSNFTKLLKRLEADGLIVRDAPTPTGLHITAAGLRAVLGVSVAVGELDVDADAFFTTHDQIVPNPNNPRKAILDGEIADLADTIVEKGVLQPLLVYPPDGEGRRMLHAGEKRWRAIGLAIGDGRLEASFRIPCREREPSEEEAAVQTASIALIENGQRSGLSMIEEARAWLIVVEANPGLPIAVVAKRHGRDKRTVQEFVKVLREARPEDIDRCETGDPDMKWEALRDSVKSIKLSPAQALIVLEVCARMDTEEPAAYEDEEGPDWIEVAEIPQTGPQTDLIARGVLQFRTQDEGKTRLCRLRIDNPKIEGFVDTAFGADPGERRSLDEAKREDALFRARAAEIGGFAARDHEQSGKWVTPWLNVEWPTLSEIRADLDAEPSPVIPEAAEQLSGTQPDGAPADTAPAPSPAPTANQEPAPVVPTPRQRLILAEIAHKSLTDSLPTEDGAATAPAARIVGTFGGELELLPLRQRGWINCAVAAAPPREGSVWLLPAGWLILTGVADPGGLNVESLLSQVRGEAGLTLHQRHELASTGGYAFAPLNISAPPISTSEAPEPIASRPAPPEADQPDRGALGSEATSAPPNHHDLPALAPEAGLALVELAAAVAREGRSLPGKPWRVVAVHGYHLDAQAGVLSHQRLVAWATHDGQWYGYIKERGEAWLRHVDVDPAGPDDADIAWWRADAKAALPTEGATWATPFLNPKAAPQTGPEPRHPDPEPPPASAARAPVVGALQLIRELAEDAQWASEHLSDALSKHPPPMDRMGEALTRIAEIQDRAARARDFLVATVTGAGE